MTPFWWWGLRLWEVGAKFTVLGVRVSPVLILGPVLATPFFELAGVFFRLADLSWEADDLINNIRVFVHQLRYGGLVSDLIRQVFWAWDRFRSDPYGFINDALTHLFWRWNQFRHDPWGFINDRIAERFGDWNWFRSDPLGWLRYQIEHRLGLGSGFFADPTGWIKERLYNRYPLLRGFFDDPMGWLRTIIGLYYGIGSDFFDDPTRWVWDRIVLAVEKYLEENTEWLAQTVSRVINRLWVTRIP